MQRVRNSVHMAVYKTLQLLEARRGEDDVRGMGGRMGTCILSRHFSKRSSVSAMVPRDRSQLVKGDVTCKVD